jgi:hypothetical protein
MDFITVNAYLDRMPFTDRYDALTDQEREAVVFAATELLGDVYGMDQLTDRAVALQTLYMVEGEAEEFAKLKRHGVKSYNVKGVSVSFEGAGISPDVDRILSRPLGRAGTGRLI